MGLFTFRLWFMFILFISKSHPLRLNTHERFHSLIKA